MGIICDGSVHSGISPANRRTYSSLTSKVSLPLSYFPAIGAIPKDFRDAGRFSSVIPVATNTKLPSISRFSGSVTSVSFSQPLKQSLPISFTLFGILISSREVQSINVPSPSTSIPSGITMLCNKMHPRKLLPPSTCKPSGNWTSFNLSQLSNVALPSSCKDAGNFTLSMPVLAKFSMPVIAFKFSGNTTSVSSVHPRNRLCPLIISRFLGNITFFRFSQFLNVSYPEILFIFSGSSNSSIPISQKFPFPLIFFNVDGIFSSVSALHT